MSAPKGYAPVPLEERIDDDVESPQNDAEQEEEDELYTSNAPLLSSRSRGNEPPPSDGRPCWYHRLTTWRPFRRNREARSWQTPRKPRNWRRIFLFTFIGTLLLALIGVSAALGVINREYQNLKWHSSHDRYSRYERHTRLPFNERYYSYNNWLNFKALYPSLDWARPTACSAAWNTLTHVSCHEKIWNRSWDNGTFNSLFDPDPEVYAETICTTSCKEQISDAYRLISSQCTEDDTFDMTDYHGPFSVDAGLEAGPLGVITTIAKRISHTCQREPRDNSGYGYYYRQGQICSGVLWRDWHIVDGMNTANLNGLDAFEARTRRSRIDNGYGGSRNVQDTCDDISFFAYRPYKYRTMGPTANSTTCDWCTMNWFERKLLSWKKNEVRDPKTGDVVEVEDYLKKIRHLGERCEADAWDRVWSKALRKYKRNGDLPGDWDGEGKNIIEIQDWNEDEAEDLEDDLNILLVLPDTI